MSALSFHQLRKRYGALEVLRGVDLDIPQGQRHALIGPNGAGKSTLFDIASGRIPATSGTVRVNGREVSGLPPQRIARLGLARSFQVTSLFAQLSVFENIRCAVLAAGGHRYAAWRRPEGIAAVAQRSAQVLADIGLEARRDAPAGELAYAEQRALELGVTIAGGAAVILLDEPTAGMSRAETLAAVELIRRVSQGRTLLIIEHDMDVVFNLAERISVLVRGELVASGAPEAIRNDNRVREAYLGASPEQKESA